MLRITYFIYAVIIASALAPFTIRAQDDSALLQLLVRKKIITEQDAREVRAELVRQKTFATAANSGNIAGSVPVESSASKWKLSTPITEIELYGDTRVRFDYRGGETAGTSDHPNDWLERRRERYRLRLGLRGVLADDWFFGLRLETSTNPRSSNVTFGDDTSTTVGTATSINGPFAKNNDGVYIGQAYLGYKGLKDFTFTAGRMPNPLVNTWMVWDPDINPEGAAEQWKHTFTFGAEPVATQQMSYSKDGKAVATAPASSSSSAFKLDLFVNLAQFVYDDTSIENPLGIHKTNNGNTIPSTDAWMLAWQIGARFTFPNNLYAQIAPTIYNYTGQGDTFLGPYQGGDPTLSNSASLAENQTSINNLLVFDVPAEIGWKVGKIPMHVFGDFAVNLEGDERATAAGHPTKGDQRYAYVVGAGVGQLKHRGDWQVDGFWQQDQQFALDPNLIDDDIFDAHLNMEGVGVRASYALSDAVSFNITYNYAWRSDATLGTGGVGAIAVNPIDTYQLFMADLNLKF
jgi:hypothetical protein